MSSFRKEWALTSVIALATGLFAYFTFVHALGVIVSSEMFYLYMISVGFERHIGSLVVIEILPSLVISLSLVLITIFYANKKIAINKVLFNVLYASVVIVIFFFSAAITLHPWVGFEGVLMSFFKDSVYMGLLMALLKPEWMSLYYFLYKRS